ncbi:hypothetical protein V1289_005265 [Bradyrhizobium sp. AZCC 2289]
MCVSRVIVDTTVQPKSVAFPTDAKLLNRAREKLVTLAKKLGVELRQSYTRVGKSALIQHQRYAHAKQFKRANRALRTLKTYLGRDIARKIDGDHGLEGSFAHLLSLSRRVREQERGQRGAKVNKRSPASSRVSATARCFSRHFRMKALRRAAISSGVVA